MFFFKSKPIIKNKAEDRKPASVELKVEHENNCADKKIDDKLMLVDDNENLKNIIDRHVHTLNRLVASVKSIQKEIETPPIEKSDFNPAYIILRPLLEEPKEDEVEVKIEIEKPDIDICKRVETPNVESIQQEIPLAKETASNQKPLLEEHKKEDIDKRIERIENLVEELQQICLKKGDFVVLKKKKQKSNQSCEIS